ncbi:hypothetical protein PRIPAC_96317 [Pristionchus pacificus]|nr:hypothetical protein PRIPAC_96317 [Pristionchus pacificus]
MPIQSRYLSRISTEQLRCGANFDCYNTEFRYFFGVYKSLFHEVEEDLDFFAKNVNSSIRNGSLTLSVTSSVIQHISARINFNATSSYFTSIQNRLAVMEYLNQNNTASIVGLDAVRRLSDDLRSDILESLRRTTWLSDVDSFGLNILDQFVQSVNAMRIYTDFDKFDTDLTYIRSLNKKFSAHYYESVVRKTGCQWLDVATALESGKLMLLEETTDYEILSLLVRLQNSFQFNAFNFYNNIILLATTFFPLAQNASEPAFVVHY